METYNCEACKINIEQLDSESDMEYYLRIIIHQNTHILYSTYLTAQNTNRVKDKGISRFS